MDELLVRGVIIGGMFAILGLMAHYAWKLMRSPSEGARRLRLTLGIAMSAFTLWAMLATIGVGPTIITVVVCGAIWWIRRGLPIPSQNSFQIATFQVVRIAPWHVRPHYGPAATSTSPPTLSDWHGKVF